MVFWQGFEGVGQRMEIKAVMLKEQEGQGDCVTSGCQFRLTKKEPCFRETIAPSSGQKRCIARGENQTPHSYSL